MGAGKPRVAACAGPGAPGLALLPLLALTALLALLASGCASTSPLAAALALGPTPSPATATATATVTPQTVPELGSMSYGTFPASKHGMDALVVCEQWAALRGEYVGRLRADTPYELEQWFSGRAWRTAFQADRPLKTDPNFSKINAAFGLVSTGAAASAANAKLLDEACASAD
jgi:hypothetical protein